MTQELISQGNKMIAEFMGADKAIDPRDLIYHYHTSWDWIMPVVEKIESMSVNTKWIGDNVYLRHYPSMPLNGRFYARFCSATSCNNWYIGDVCGSSKIEAAWLSTIEFIKWYNDLTK